MHIEPGVVEGAKTVLGFALGAGVTALAAKSWVQEARTNGVAHSAMRVLLCAVLTFVFFEMFWRQSIGVSEVHLIFGASLYLLFGFAPAAVGLLFGLLLQGVWVSPSDLPQFGMNVTTLLVPLLAVHAYAKKVIPATSAYVDLSYTELLKISGIYQGGIILWVSFWVFFGQGVTTTSLAGVASFASLYATVIVVESLVSVSLLYAIKRFKLAVVFPFFAPRMIGSR